LLRHTHGTESMAKKAAISYGAEFTLLLQCCQARFHTAVSGFEKAQSNFNEDLFVGLVKNHRVSSFVVEQLNRLHISERAKKEVKKLNKESRQRALAQCKGLVDLHETLKPINVPFIVLKGVLLSQKLYEDLAFRSSRDIDILIQPRDVLRTYRHLLDHGFKQLEPELRLTEKNLDTYLRLTNQISFGSEQGQMLELHWALFKGKGSFPYSHNEVWEHTQTTSLMGREFLVLEDFICFQFLYVHGARHHYSNLFWLLDVVTLANRMTKELLQQQVEFAFQKDLDRQLALSLQLSKELLQEAPVSLNRTDKKTLDQVSFVQQYIEAGVPRENTIAGNWKLLNYRSGLRRSWNYKMGHFKLFSLKDFSTLPLPTYAQWLYFFIRPFILLWRYIGKAVGR